MTSPNAGHAKWAAGRRAEAEAQHGSLQEAQRARNREKALAYYHRNKEKIKPVAAPKARRLNRVRGSHPMRQTAPRSPREVRRALVDWNSQASLREALKLEAVREAMDVHNRWVEGLDDDGVLWPVGEAS